MLTNPRDALRGQSRSTNIAFHMLDIVSFCVIVTLSLRRAGFPTLDFKKMWPWNPGQRSLKVIESRTIWNTVYGFILVFFGNIIPKTHRFWDIRLQNCHDLENRVLGPSRSLEMSPCDRARTTSYWRSIVTMAQSCVISEIFNVKKCRDLEIGVKGHWWSLRVMSFGILCVVCY